MLRLNLGHGTALLVAWCVACGESPELTGADSGGDGRPKFAGVAEADVLTESSVRLSWAAGSDDVTPARRLVYRAYQGIGNAPIPLDEARGVSLPGETSLVVTGLSKGRYRFVVRARDEAGNEDENVAAVRVSVGDGRAPEFAGVSGALALGARKVLVEWKPASDDVSPAELLRYRVFASNKRETVFDSEVMLDSADGLSTPGATSAIVAVAKPETEYFFAVRAEDEAGNVDENARIVSTLTKEGEPPVFSGVSLATATSTSVTVSWPAAVDNVTALSRIVYEVFLGTKSGGYNLLTPALVTEAGVVRATLSGLTPDTDYFVLVRARDAAGNTDKNAKELKVTTAPPDTVPPLFAGVTDVDAPSPRTLYVSWANGTDSVTPAEKLVYQVFLAEGADAFDFSKPAFVSEPGELSVDLFKKKPGTTYRAVVRAVDEAGNVDGGTTELSATTGPLTPDLTVPDTLVSLSATAVSADGSRLLINWPVPSDGDADASELRVHLCVGVTTADCDGDSFYENWNASSAFGSTAAFVRGLTPRTAYSVVGRVEDISGNIEEIGRATVGTTATSFAYNIFPLIEARCNQCHDYSYASLVNVDSAYDDPMLGSLAFIKPTEPAKSYFLRKMLALGSSEAPFSISVPNFYDEARMPSDASPYLTSEELAALVDWISLGAFEN